MNNKFAFIFQFEFSSISVQGHFLCVSPYLNGLSYHCRSNEKSIEGGFLAILPPTIIFKKKEDIKRRVLFNLSFSPSCYLNNLMHQWQVNQNCVEGNRN